MLSELLAESAIRKIEVNFLTCQHCGHQWISRKIPKQCSHCLSKNWQRSPRYTSNTSKTNERYLPQRSLNERKARYYSPYAYQDKEETRRLELIKTMTQPTHYRKYSCLSLVAAPEGPI